MILFLISFFNIRLLGLELHEFFRFSFCGVSWSHILSHKLVEFIWVDSSFFQCFFLNWFFLMFIFHHLVCMIFDLHCLSLLSSLLSLLSKGEAELTLDGLLKRPVRRLLPRTSRPSGLLPVTLFPVCRGKEWIPWKSDFCCLNFDWKIDY